MSNLFNPPTVYPGIAVQSDVGGSRVSATTYQNTGVTPIFACVVMSVPLNGSGNALVDSNPVPILQVAYVANTNLTAIVVQMSFWVPPGNYYTVTANGGSSIVVWVESK